MITKPWFLQMPNPFILLTCLTLLCFGSMHLDAAEVVVKFEVENPIEKTQSVEIKYALPVGTRTVDIVDFGGLELKFNEDQNVLSLYKKCTLGPKEVRTFRVKMKDVWTIPFSEVHTLREDIRRLVPKLKQIETDTAKQNGGLVVGLLFRAADLNMGIEELERFGDSLTDIEKRSMLTERGITEARFQQLAHDRKSLDRLEAGLGQISQMIRDYELNPPGVLKEWIQQIDAIRYAPVVHVRLLPCGGLGSTLDLGVSGFGGIGVFGVGSSQLTNEPVRSIGVVSRQATNELPRRNGEVLA